MLKKIVFLFLVCTLISGVLFAGGGGQRTSAPLEIVESPNFNRTGYPIVNEPIHVRTVLLRLIDNHPRELWLSVARATNIHVEFQGIDPMQVPTFMAAGDWPDSFHSNLNNSFINDHGIIGNNLVDFNYLLDYMPNLQRTFQDYPMSRRAVTEYNGAIYQMPFIEIQVTAHGPRFYYRTDILRNHNITPVRTVDEFYNALVTLRNATGQAHLLATATDLEGYFYSSFGSSLEADFDSDAQGRVVYNRTSEQYRRFLRFFHRLYAEGLLHREFLTLDNFTRLQLGRQGYVAFGSGPSFEALLVEDFPSGNFDISTPAPLFSQWNNATQIKARLGDTRRAGGAINARTRYIPELARMFDLHYTLSEILPNTGLYGVASNYGPEGYWWAFTSPAKAEMDFWIPTQHPDVTNFPQMQWERNVMLENFIGRAEFGNAVTSNASNNRSRQIGFRDYLMPNATKIYFPGNPGQFNFLKYSPDEQTVLDRRFTDINTYVDQMRAQFITGVSDLDRDWAEYERTINAMGIQEVIRIIQASYDRWNRL